ncbi:cobalt-precorrin-5B (C(1))-methyltransferase CbiD [Vagococcus carniphilus]|uniref:Cobalt-precorrin-5B C(1)-methyltransferase n=1 Tax=Vagococcus carniphilus TaxID=218144 RepID=A0AAW8U0J1_9ENTE|nr:cobalt-precorrin-5B (C(1))-methyltransferase CbiD [Vagococcus carniphilus]MDT2830543.1 cobalt-precorrin-5B (C(1))-methyltransferase CbiD [Vagococcus carniphilus]MDT2832589.1 cobalt-precorrin-5B (C(1))-methyltransferase CbiD [Vagococcus carniphilus]MDT2839841.1 cobalt-precorrin-5B (C(1))-methyltransferase CbiD [Vagococcus carniphilus]MDT2854712.1 cobalt-precorrin-5B (C(1))-methyltransferase CbiD [Vagococcus carniphilus]
MEEFVYVNGKKMRKGYTTGSCATAASVAATHLLLNEEECEEVVVLSPVDKEIRIPIESIERVDDKTAIASVRKNGGDDADATHGMLIYSKVTLRDDAEVTIEGGEGIGRVTQEGLLVPIGKPAINPKPRKMIGDNIRKMLGESRGADILIFAPEGYEIAKQTMNRNLGIIGGISILGTTGIVTPMSEDSWKAAISIELEMKKKQGFEKIVLSPGNYGEDFAVNKMMIDETKIVSMSNFVGYVLKEVQRIGFEEVLMIGHLGKLIKVSAGIFSTHSKDADARAEILVANLALMGMPIPDLERVSKCLTTEAAGDIISETGYEGVYQIIADKIKFRSEKLLKYRDPKVKVDVVLFSSKTGLLSSTKPIKELMEEWK